MVTLEQLEQLEGRIVKALELISDLRVENSHLESESERLKASNDQLRLTAEEREREALK
jgi:FtsZ-binding cell division protein ZapB